MKNVKLNNIIKVSIKVLNFFNEEIIIKGLINKEELKEVSFKLYEDINDKDFFIIHNKEIKELIIN